MDRRNAGCFYFNAVFAKAIIVAVSLSCRVSVVVITIALLLTPDALADELQRINIVDDVAEWPPYLYRQALSDSADEQTPVGFSMDVITTILERNDMTFDIELLPFARALKQLEEGERHQLLLNASFVEERAEKFLYTLPYYTLRHVAFYSAKKHPEGLTIKSIDDLVAHYKICGLRGYSYGSAGIDDRAVNMNFSTYDQLIQVLQERLEVCDVFIEGYEVLAGFKVIGADYLADADLKYAIVPGMDPKGYHMIISKNAKHAAALKALLDQGIMQLQQSGEMDMLLDKYFLRH